MKKCLLMGAFLLSSFLTVKAQDTCATAVSVVSGSTTVVGTINGTAGNSCFGGTTAQNGSPLATEWYSFTPTANGLLTVSSNVAPNPATTDTRLSIFTGACGALACYNFNDDIDANATPANFMSAVTIPVASGVTYYIAWDNFWATTGFSFTVNFEAEDCLSPNTISVETTITSTTAATINWDEAVGTPANYDVQHGPAGFVPGAGTTVSVDTNTASLTGLTESGNLWYYVRSNCGATQGAWVGPFSLTLPSDLPYSNYFDDADNRADGFVNVGGWGLSTNPAGQPPVSHSGDAFLFSNVTTGASNAWIIAKPLLLEAGEIVDLTFQTRLVAPSGQTTLEVTVGNSTALASQEVIETIEITAGNNYEERNVTFTADTAGLYYVGFHNTRAAGGVAGALVLDTYDAVEDTNGTNDVLASKFSVFPNPANNVVTVANAENILVNGITVTDLNGRTVKAAKFDGVSEAQINVSDLASGVYMMTVSSDKGTMTKKIVKN